MDLNISIRNLLQVTIAEELSKGLEPDLSIKLIEILLECECDYFDMMRIIAKIEPEDYSEEVIDLLISLLPQTSSLTLIHDLKLSTIHSMIPRWTATRYHTGPIQKVLEDIRQKCESGKIGIYAYHSNLNTNNHRSFNDPYVLMITSTRCCFLDLNRKRAYQYIY